MGQGLYEGFITFFVALQRTLKIFLTQICSLETKKLTFFFLSLTKDLEKENFVPGIF